ncbi:MAG: replication initiation protein [Deltaproteobacteria bacterium]|nr:replication initiation protein [Deltaproteobacteria bacterium]
MSKEGIMTDQEKYQVIQSNPLINAQYKLDLVEQKVLRYIISMIKTDDEKLEKKYYRVNLEELRKYLGWHEKTGEIFEYIKKVADKLKSTTVKVIKPTSTIVTSWIASYEYPKDKGWIEFEISSKLESELLKLKEQFTKYYLKNISKLKSQYSIRLYELLRQYLPVGKREIEIETLKAMLGIGKDEYKLFADFKKRVIEKSAREINQKTDLDFKVKYVKEARKVVSVLFYDIQQKVQIPPSVMNLIPERYRENRQVLNIVRKYLELMGEEYVIEKLNYTNYIAPRSWPDYFYRTCEENWGAGFTPSQTSIPGVIETIEDGTIFEIGGKTYKFENGIIKIQNSVIPEGYLRQMLREGKAKIVASDAGTDNPT